MKDYIYKLRVTDTSQSRRVYPLFGDDVSFKWGKESGEQYFRQNLSGTFTFVNEDFDFIYGKDIETEFNFLVYDANKLVWEGKFYKTDCEMDIESRTLQVSPEMSDMYSDVLSGIEKEYDLIKILPDIKSIYLDKRSMIQIYVLGDSKVSCFFQGMTWEQSCKEVDNESELKNRYFFGEMTKKRLVELSGVKGIPQTIWGNVDNYSHSVPFSLSRGEFTFAMAMASAQGGFYATLYKKGVAMWKSKILGASSFVSKFQMDPVAGSGATGVIDVEINDATFFGRYLCDVDEVKIGTETLHPSALPSEDMVSDNRNFRKALYYGFKNTIEVYDEISRNITQWYYNDDMYYQKPPHGGSTGIPDYYPIAQSYWTGVSFWFRFDLNDSLYEPQFRKEYLLKDAYPLGSVIDTLLQEITKGSHNGICFYDEPKYSHFLYDTFNPLTAERMPRLFLSQKSNILAGEYEQPAQKAVITLRQILDMLRDAFRCYWWIDWDDEEGMRALHIEHISYFMRGGSYSSAPKVGIDLTQLVNPRNGKAWSYGTGKVAYSKDELPEHYEFKWMDDTTSYFEGNPIEIESKYVKSGEIESITIDKFNSDLDYMLLNPSASEKDGFALIGAMESNGKWKVPYYNPYGTMRDDIILQNGHLSFFALQAFYLYDMPAWNIKVNGEKRTSIDIKKSMTQDVICPNTEFNTQELVRTEVGDGQIESAEMNLSTQMLEISLVFTPK